MGCGDTKEQNQHNEFLFWTLIFNNISPLQTCQKEESVPINPSKVALKPLPIHKYRYCLFRKCIKEPETLVAKGVCCSREGIQVRTQSNARAGSVTQRAKIVDYSVRAYELGG